MRFPWLVGLTVQLALGPIPLGGQQLDSRLLGNWTLDVARSTFGPDGPPTSGTVRWTRHGWVLALAFGGGYVYADAVITDHGCELIGVPPDYSCALALVSPTHLRFTLRQGTVIRRVGDIELVAPDTTRTIHRVTPGNGPPYTETTFWAREHD